MSHNNHVHRIVCGYFIVELAGQKYKVVSPNPDILYRADLYYQEVIAENRFDTWASDSDIVKLLISNGEWTAESDENMKKLSGQIDDYKHQAYTAYTQINFPRIKELKSLIQQCRDKESQMKNTRNKYMHLTLEGHAEILRREFILARCIVGYKPDDLYFLLLNKIQAEVNKQMVGIDDIRKIARTEPWISIWTTSGQNPFRIFKNKFHNDEQRSLVMYTRMYDNVQKHQHCPPPAVINDDDLLDGWLIEQKNNRDNKDNGNKPERKGWDKAQEIFKVVDKRNKFVSVEEQIKDIENMNSGQSKIIKKQREQTLKKHGVVADNRLPDKQKEIAQKLSDNYIQHMRGLKQGRKR